MSANAKGTRGRAVRFAPILALVGAISAPGLPAAAAAPEVNCLVYPASARGEGHGTADGGIVLVLEGRTAVATCSIDRDYCLFAHAGDVHVDAHTTTTGVAFGAWIGPAGGVLVAQCYDEGQEPPEPVQVEIDVKPGDQINTVNTRSHGVIPVAVLTTPDFDAAGIDGSTACFGDAEDRSQVDCSELTGAGALEDVDGDGDRDLMLHFHTDETGIDEGDESACLSAATFDGVVVEGCDAISTVD